MTAPRRRVGGADGPGNAAVKGLILVAAAVLLGAALLLKSLDDGGPLHTGTGTSHRSTTTTSIRGATTTTAPVAHDPASVKVLVLNGVDKAKPIASGAAQVLKAANYTTLAPGDAASAVPNSAVYYTTGYSADAAKVASLLGAPPTSVGPIPSPVPTVIGDAKDANVVVVVGPDATAVPGVAPTKTSN